MLNGYVSTIGIIDSGIGGVSILKKLISKFNCGNYIYYADNLHMPYGKKNKTFILKRILNLIDIMKNAYKVDLIIIACNTASSVVANMRIENVLCMSFNKELTYLATPLTAKQLKGYNVIKDTTLACEIEKNIEDKKAMDKIVKKHIKRYKLNYIKNLVLGCTHYELVEDLFKKYCSKTSVISNSSFVLENINVINKELNVVFLTSKQSDKYVKKLQTVLRS